ncbi:MAG TPA: D-amino acid aminotransferase [Gammaproteobacteria bacterium]|nr:D-amino acid aminotransferase [Gammaproteobacteria bacterium]
MANPFATVFLNGRFMPLAEARISPLDRGFLFGDGVYEVIPVYSGKPFRLAAHLRRLQYSLDAIRLANPHRDAQWEALLRELVDQNGGGQQAVYLQITRGADQGRDHAFPAAIPATVFAMSSPLADLPDSLKLNGGKVITLSDIRWRRCDIKSVALLGNVLLRQTATDQACDEAILIHDGYATEGTASSLFIVHGGTIMTPPKSTELLPSITRDAIVELAAQHTLPLRQERIPEAELHAAEEAWLASSTREVYAITELDGQRIGSGKPGPHWRRMYDAFQELKHAEV